jgi:hypothetical protein
VKKRNPKSEIRIKSQTLNPKSEIQVRNTPDIRPTSSFGHWVFFRISDFGLRISPSPTPSSSRITMSTPISGSSAFQTAAATINSTSSYVLVDTILVPPGLRGRPFIVKGVVGSGGGLAGLQFTEAALSEDPHYALAQDADFNSPTTLMPFATSNAYLTAANGQFILRFAAAPPEFALWAKAAGANTTLQISGSVLA